MILTLIMSSGSVLNVIGIDEVLRVASFVIVGVLALCLGELRRDRFRWSILIVLSFVLFVALFQALVMGDLSILLCRGNISMLVMLLTCCLAAAVFRSQGGFPAHLLSVLHIFVLYGIVACLIMSIFPSNKIVFEAIDGNGRYSGHSIFLFQRLRMSGLGEFLDLKKSLFGLTVERAHGLAWEPGNYAAYVNIYVFLNLFHRLRWRNVVIGIFAVLLSQSTSGLIILSIQLSYFFVRGRPVITQRARLGGLFFGLVSFALIVFTTFDNVNEKISGSRSGSGAVRVANTLSAFRGMYQRPFLGTSVCHGKYSKEMDASMSEILVEAKALTGSSGLEGYTSTNSFLKLFVQWGIPIGVISTFALFRQNSNLTKGEFLELSS